MKHYDYPEKEGNIDIRPEISDACSIGVVIIGDKSGLRYLSKLLNWLAEYDQENNHCESKIHSLYLSFLVSPNFYFHCESTKLLII